MLLIGLFACVAANTLGIVASNVLATSLDPAGKELVWVGQRVAVRALGPSFLCAVMAHAGYSFAGRTRLMTALWLPSPVWASLGLTIAAHP